MTFAVLLAILTGLVPGLFLLGGYIGGNAFPRPLPPPEEARALRELMAGLSVVVRGINREKRS